MNPYVYSRKGSEFASTPTAPVTAWTKISSLFAVSISPLMVVVMLTLSAGTVFAGSFGVSQLDLDMATPQLPPLHALAGKILGDSIQAYPTGSLVNDKGTVYFIRGSLKIPFTSMQVFSGLGYSTKNVVTGDLTGYTLSPNYILNSPSQDHPWGSWLIFQGSVYYSTQAGLIEAQSPETFSANGGKFSYIVQANSADIAILTAHPGLAPLVANDPRLVVIIPQTVVTPTVVPPVAPVIQGNANDYNNDGKVDSVDMGILSAVVNNLQSCPTGKTCDINGDGQLNILDLNYFQVNNLQGMTPTTPTITGATSLAVATSTTYSFVSTDQTSSGYNGGLITYAVNWGDGSPISNSNAQSSGTAYVASHAWASAGTYTLTVTATPALGTPAKATQQVVVTQPATVPDFSKFDYNNDGKVDTTDMGFLSSVIGNLQACPPNKTCDINGDGQLNVNDLAYFKINNNLQDQTPTVPVITGAASANVGISNAYSFVSTDQTSSGYNGGLITYSVNWGDGSSLSNSDALASGAAFSASHSWVNAGTFTITVFATPALGLASKATMQVSVTLLAQQTQPPQAQQQPASSLSVKLSSLSPVSQYVTAGQTGQVLTRYTITGASLPAAATIQEMDFTVSGTASAPITYLTVMNKVPVTNGAVNVTGLNLSVPNNNSGIDVVAYADYAATAQTGRNFVLTLTKIIYSVNGATQSQDINLASPQMGVTPNMVDGTAPSFSMPTLTNANINSPTSFSLSAYDAQGGPLTAKVSWSDGSSDTATASSQANVPVSFSQFTHTYTQAGTYNVIITVTDSGGMSTTKGGPVVISSPTQTSSAPLTVALNSAIPSISGKATVNGTQKVGSFILTAGSNSVNVSTISISILQTNCNSCFKNLKLMVGSTTIGSPFLMTLTVYQGYGFGANGSLVIPAGTSVTLDVYADYITAAAQVNNLPLVNLSSVFGLGGSVSIVPNLYGQPLNITQGP